MPALRAIADTAANSLEARLIATSPVGVTRRDDTPGAFAAIVVKRENGQTRVFYHGRNDHSFWKAAQLRQAYAFLDTGV